MIMSLTCANGPNSPRIRTVRGGANERIRPLGTRSFVRGSNQAAIVDELKEWIMPVSERRVTLAPASEIEPRAYHGGWGPWRLEPATRVLYHPGAGYEVDLDRCTSPAELLDWIFQVSAKTWADHETMSGLIRAVDDVLKPQANLCPSGSARRMSRRQIAVQVEDAAAHCRAGVETRS